MSEETVITPETVTDAMVDQFFSNEGVMPNVKVEETVEDAKETEKAAIEQPVEEEKPKEEKKVNLGALHEERAKRKAEAERAKKAEERAAELERRLAERDNPPEAQYEEDPVEALRRDQEKIKQVLLAQANAHVKQTEEEKYWANIAEYEKEYKADKPDFDDAIKSLSTSRLEELHDLGFSEEEANKVLSDEIRWIANKAIADEVNPAERFYNLAKKRGFKPAEAAKPNDSDAKLKTIKKGMETNKALPPASKSVNQDLTLEALADMKVDALTSLRGQTEFDKAWAKHFG